MPTSSSFRCLSFALTLLALPVEGQEFVRKFGGYEVLVKAGEQNGVLEISPVTPGSLKAFTIPSPRRLVIDLPMRESVQNEAIEVAPEGFIQRLRVGTHPDRMRIVVDVGSEVLRYAQRLEGKTSIFALRSGDQRSTSPKHASGNDALGDNSTGHSLSQSATSDTNTIKITEGSADLTDNEKAKNPPGQKESPLEAVEPRRGVSLSQAALGSSVPTLTERTPLPTRVSPSQERLDQKSSKETPNQRDKEKRARLSAIEFHPESLEVRLKFTARAPFGLVRRNSREYVVTMPGGGITSDALTLDHFPPRELVGFTFVRAVEVGGTLHIEVGVDLDTKITAVPDGSGVVLKASVRNRP